VKIPTWCPICYELLQKDDAGEYYCHVHGYENKMQNEILIDISSDEEKEFEQASNEFYESINPSQEELDTIRVDTLVKTISEKMNYLPPEKICPECFRHNNPGCKNKWHQLEQNIF
jgi:uncharacterized Zn finger protein (UPF0148 family)